MGLLNMWLTPYMTLCDLAYFEEGHVPGWIISVYMQEEIRRNLLWDETSQKSFLKRTSQI